MIIFSSITEEKKYAKKIGVSPYQSQFSCKKQNQNVRTANSMCILCSREYRKKYYTTEKGRERARKDYVKLRNKGYFESAEYKEKEKSYRKEYLTSPEARTKIQERERKYRKTEKGKLVTLKSQRNYRKKNYHFIF